MFGTLKPHPCSLDERGKAGYGAFYCGLCKALGEGYDTPTRALLSHDAVFLAILADSLADEGAAPSSCRCPMLPVVHRPTRAFSSPALRFAASAQMLLADQLLADRAMDGRALFGAARRLLSGKVARARGLLGELGVDLSELDGFEHRQARREAKGAPVAESDEAAAGSPGAAGAAGDAKAAGAVGPEQAAEPTAEALALVFGRVAELPGLGFRARSSSTRRALRSLGRSVGTVIYLVDALDDLRDDHLEGSFNPCLEESPSGRRPSPALVERCSRGAREALAEARLALARLPLRRHRKLLESIVVAELSSQARQASQKARAWASPAGARHLEARKQGVLARGSEAFLAALAFVWAWVWALPEAFAQSTRRPRGPLPLPDGGAKGAGRGMPRPDGRPLDAGLAAPALDGGCDAGPDAGADGGCDAGPPDAAGQGDSWLDDLDGGSFLDGGPDIPEPDWPDAPGRPDAGPGASRGGHGFGCPCTDLCNAIARCLEEMGGCFKECGKCVDGCAKCDLCSGCKVDRCCDCNGCCKEAHCDSCCNSCDPGKCCNGCDLGKCCNGLDCGGCCKGADCGGCCKGGDCGGGCCKGCASATDGGCGDGACS